MEAKCNAKTPYFYKYHWYLASQTLTVPSDITKFCLQRFGRQEKAVYRPLPPTTVHAI